jgi:tRNA dimethylallyltransferase
MDIGTAKPSREQRRRVPHHLIDVAEPEENWSLATFKQAAGAAIEQVQAREGLPMLVGGSGQYVTAILEGWSPPEQEHGHRLRDSFEAVAAAEGPQALHRRLQAVDPDSAQRIEPTNVRRVARALEIFELTGAPASSQRRASPPPYRTLRLGLSLPRPELYARIDRRIDEMIEAGLVAEVQSLLDRGIRLDHPPMSAIGYRQIGEHLMGNKSLQAAVSEMRRLTRQFVRRQANWFKPGDSRIEWHTAQPGVERMLTDRILSWMDEA